jgi:LmbE family N-acetylglucosaminyl deacetylase
MRNLFIGAHPDDIEIMCAGTIFNLKAKGQDCHAVIMTNGKGREGDRHEEQKKAWRMLNITGQFLDLEDGYLQHDSQTLGILDQIIVKYSPDRVFTHNIYDIHQDHIATARLVTGANRHSIFDLYYFPASDVKQNFEANIYEDITDVFKKKLAVLKVFNSQQERFYMRQQEAGCSMPFARHVERYQLVFKKGIESKKFTDKIKQ